MGRAAPELSRTPGELEPVETASRDELAALQLARLRWTLAHAYENVPFYRRAFGRHDVHPDDCRSLDDLRRFPFTTKQDLQQTYPFGLLAVPRERLARIHASSGTTGRPTVAAYTLRDVETWANVVARSIRAAGGRPGDLVHVAHGYGLFTGGLGVHYGAERLGCAVVPVSAGMTDRQAQLIVDFEPDLIVTTPSYMLAIVDALESRGVDPAATSLRIGMFGAEPWTDDMRQELEERLGIRASDLYGLTELIGPGVAVECVETRDGPHVWEDHFYPEVVDPATGEALPDGTFGELVLTSLTKEAMPVVRYRTRDLTRLLPGTARTMRRIARVSGRTDDMIVLRGVNVFPTQIEELILRTAGLAPHYQLVLTRPTRLDELTVRVEARRGAAASERAAAALRLAELVRQNVGLRVLVDVLDHEVLERSLGKTQHTVDLRATATVTR